MLNFSSERSGVNMALGYYDAQKVLYGLYGHDYYIDRTFTEKEAYEIVVSLLGSSEISLRKLNEEVIPDLANKLHSRGDYYDLFIVMMERLAKSCSLTPFRIRTDKESIFKQSFRERTVPVRCPL
jgi:NTE family protein